MAPAKANLAIKIGQLSGKVGGSSANVDTRVSKSLHFWKRLKPQQHVRGRTIAQVQHDLHRVNVIAIELNDLLSKIPNKRGHKAQLRKCVQQRLIDVASFAFEQHKILQRTQPRTNDASPSNGLGRLANAMRCLQKAVQDVSLNSVSSQSKDNHQAPSGLSSAVYDHSNVLNNPDNSADPESRSRPRITRSTDRRLNSREWKSATSTQSWLRMNTTLIPCKKQNQSSEIKTETCEASFNEVPVTDDIEKALYNIDSIR